MTGDLHSSKIEIEVGWEAVFGWIVAGVAAGAVGAAGAGATAVVTQPEDSGPSSTVGTFPLVVTNIVDGDTFDASANGRNFRVRLILIDTPEMVDDHGQPECLALEAKARLAALLPVGSTATGEYDADPIDPYGRDLLYVWTKDQEFVNRDLVAEGLANVMYVAPNGARRGEIEAAKTSAAGTLSGLFSPAIGCTTAARQKAADDQAAAQEAARVEAERQEQLRLLAKKKREKARERREEAEYDAWLERQRPSTGGGSSGSSGYTGPRCYEPGGKTWHPC